MLVRTVQESLKIRLLAAVFGCLPEVEDKSLLLKTPQFEHWTQKVCLDVTWKPPPLGSTFQNIRRYYVICKWRDDINVLLSSDTYEPQHGQHDQRSLTVKQRCLCLYSKQQLSKRTSGLLSKRETMRVIGKLPTYPNYPGLVRSWISEETLPLLHHVAPNIPNTRSSHGFYNTVIL